MVKKTTPSFKRIYRLQSTDFEMRNASRKGLVRQATLTAQVHTSEESFATFIPTCLRYQTCNATLELPLENHFRSKMTKLVEMSLISNISALNAALTTDQVLVGNERTPGFLLQTVFIMIKML